MLALAEYLASLTQEPQQDLLLKYRDIVSACLAAFERKYPSEPRVQAIEKLHTQLQALSTIENPKPQDIETLSALLTSEGELSRSLLSSMYARGQGFFIHKMEQIGYRFDKNFGMIASDEIGYCFGIANMAMQAFLLNDFASFDSRLKEIASLSDEQCQNIWSTIKQKTLSTKQLQSLIDILAFFDGVQVYQQPFFSTSQSTVRTSLMTQPQLVKEHPDLRPQLAWTMKRDIRSKKDIVDSFSQLKQQFGLVSFSMNFSCNKLNEIGGNHAINISYSKESQSWFFTDANQLPPVEFKSDALLGEALYRAYYQLSGLASLAHGSEEPDLYLKSELFVCKKDRPLLIQCLLKLKQDPDAFKCYKMESAKILEDLYDIAISTQDKPLFQYLVDNGWDAEKSLMKAISREDYDSALFLNGWGVTLHHQGLNLANCNGNNESQIRFYFQLGIRSPLLLEKVCYANQTQLAVELLNGGILPNEMMMVTAFILQKQDLLQHLIQHGGKISQATFDSLSSHFPPVLLKQIEAVIDPNLSSSPFNSSELLSAACQSSHLTSVQWLLEQGSEPTEEMLIEAIFVIPVEQVF
ncbi:MAG: hypothetical protein NTW08_05770 [Gammaproteobacteria bacterium]|nr:hypothetical protein [Gammaproteobacteria bacterium]